MNPAIQYERARERQAMSLKDLRSERLARRLRDPRLPALDGQVRDALLPRAPGLRVAAQAG
jgi:hypothetical protein